jgi:hypothetical protein
MVKKDPNSKNHPGSNWCFSELRVNETVFKVSDVHNKQYKLDTYKINFTNGTKI